MVSCGNVNRMNRRTFLRLSAILAVSGSAPAQIAPRPSGQPRQRILIVGAGLSGLCSAFHLQQQGHEVQILEAQLRPGGRVQTLRDPFTPGLHAEAGAARVPDNHQLTMEYVRQFQLALEPFEPAGKQWIYYVNGQRTRFRSSAVQQWPLHLTVEEKQLSFDGLLAKYYNPLLSSLGKLPSGGRVIEGLWPYDKITMTTLLRQRGASPDAVKLIMLGVDPDLGSAVWTLLDDVGLFETKSFGRIVGGNDRLPQAFAARLPDRIRYGCAVVSIQQQDRKVAVIVERGGERETFTADRLVCTLPFSVAAAALRDARLSSAKWQAVQELKYTPVVKTFLQCQSRFWLNQGLNGFAHSDLSIERIWPGPGDDPNARGILHSYVMGPKAVPLQQMPEAERQKTTLAETQKLFPGINDQYEGGASKCWALDPWQKGAFAQYDPGQLHLLPLNGKQEGRIHFAGEHTSNWNGWMQGAFDSAHRVVNEINAVG